MSAFEELRVQLVKSVAERGRLRPISRRRRARAGGLGGVLTAGALALVIAAGVQRAAPTVAPGPVAEASVEVTCAACRAVSGRLHAPLAEDASATVAPNVQVHRGLPVVHRLGGLG